MWGTGFVFDQLYLNLEKSGKSGTRDLGVGREDPEELLAGARRRRPRDRLLPFSSHTQ